MVYFYFLKYNWILKLEDGNIHGEKHDVGNIVFNNDNCIFYYYSIFFQFEDIENIHIIEL